MGSKWGQEKYKGIESQKSVVKLCNSRYKGTVVSVKDAGYFNLA